MSSEYAFTYCHKFLFVAFTKVEEFALQDVVGISWNKLGLNAFLKEFPSVAMVLPLLLSHYPPPCGRLTL
jgi:hypothetical protein